MFAWSRPLRHFKVVPPPDCDLHAHWSCSDDVSRRRSNERRAAPYEVECERRSARDDAQLSDHFGTVITHNQD